MFARSKQTFDPYSEPESSINPLLRTHKEQYTFNILGEEIVVFPDVFSPKYDWSSEFFIKSMPPPHQKRVLDIGTGTGVIALFCALKGASLVHATDINPNAVANACANFEKHNVSKERCLAYSSDLFENINERFDIITFNPPYQGFRAKDMLERALTDENYSTFKQFISQVGDHLLENGTVCISWSDLGDLNLMENLLKNSEFVVEKVLEEQRGVKIFFIVLKKK